MIRRLKGFLVYDFTKFIKTVQDWISNEAAFTDDEEAVFRLRCKGKQAVEIYLQLRETNRAMSLAKVRDLSARVKRKVLAVEALTASKDLCKCAVCKNIEKL